MAEMIKFLKGSLARYNELKAANQISDGTLYFCTEGALYLGKSLIAEINMTDEGSVQELIAAALAPYYTKVEVDNLLKDYLKINDLDLSGYYTKGEADKIHEDADKATAEAIAAALAEAKKYADDNDSDTNTAHTHVNGKGTTVTAAGGIAGEVAVDLNIGIKLDNDNLVIYDKTSNTEIASMDAADLVEDSYLSDVTVTGDKKLKFTFTLNNGTTKTVDVDLESLVDVYTGSNGDEIVVGVDGYTVSASLTKAVTDDIAKGVEAHGWGNHADAGYLTEHQNISGKADKVANATKGNFAGLDANGNLTDSGKKASDFVSSEGYVAYSEAEKTKLAGIEVGAQVNVIESIDVVSFGTIHHFATITDKEAVIDITNISVGSAVHANEADSATNAGHADTAGYADNAGTATIATALDSDYRTAIVNDSCNAAKTAIQGNTAVTVEECVTAINKMNSKVNEEGATLVTLTSDVKDVVSSIDDIMEMLTWGDFPEVKNN